MIPSLIFTLITSIYIFQKIYSNKVDQGAMEIENIIEINSAKIVSKLEAINHIILITSKLIGDLDATSVDARQQSNNALKSMLVDENIYNAWMVFEPNAFDGKDFKHTKDYPGASSGRFLMSYIVVDGKIVVSQNLDESTLNNPQLSDWYIHPRDTGKSIGYIERKKLNSHNDKLNEAPINTLSLVSPIFRHGKVIGCIGVDVTFMLPNHVDSRFGYNNASVSMFYPDGRVFYSPDMTYTNDNVSTLFSHTDKIKEAMHKGEPIFLHNEHNGFLNTDAFTYFKPIKIDLFKKSLYLHVAIPETEILGDTFKMFGVLAICFIALLFLFLLLLAYVVGQITKPINSIALATDAISLGLLETEIPVSTKAIHEIDSLSRTLRKIVEQFQVYQIMQEKYQLNQFLDASLMEVIKNSKNINVTFAGICSTLQLFYWNKVRIVVLVDNRPIFTDSLSDFYYHYLLAPLVQNRKLTFFNSFSLAQHKLTFFEKDVVSICVVTLEKNETFIGYIILENTNITQSLSITDETALLHVQQVLAYWLLDIDISQISLGLEKVYNDEISLDIYQGVLSPKSIEPEILYEDPLLNVAQKIEGLDIADAISAVGGMQEIVSKSLKLTARLLPDFIHTVSELLALEDFKNFAIQIHGMKGSLKNIRANKLSKLANDLERAAYESNFDYCKQQFPTFLTAVSAFSDELNAIMIEDDVVKKAGDQQLLISVLENAQSAADDFESTVALAYMSSISAYTFGKTEDILIEKICNALEEFDCDMAITHILSLKELLPWI